MTSPPAALLPARAAAGMKICNSRANAASRAMTARRSARALIFGLSARGAIAAVPTPRKTSGKRSLVTGPATRVGVIRKAGRELGSSLYPGRTYQKALERRPDGAENQSVFGVGPEPSGAVDVAGDSVIWRPDWKGGSIA